MEKTVQVGPRFDFIDNLRGIAIIMVILRHCYNGSWEMSTPFDVLAHFSQMGVQLFFVVSAFTLCLSMDLRRSRDEGLRNYYLRRYFRIAPLFYFGILLYLVYHSVADPLISGEVPALASQYTFSAVMSNILLIHDFHPGALRVVAGGWSIGTETTFYLLFPFIFLLYKRYQSNRALVLIPVAGLAFSFLSILTLQYLSIHVFDYRNFQYFNKVSGFLYFNLICQLPVFLLGMSLYFKLIRTGNEIRWNKTAVVAGFLISLVTAVYVFVYMNHVVSLIPFTAGILFIFLFMMFKEIPALNSRWLSRIGQLSFSIYIFHFLFAWNGARFLPSLIGEYLPLEAILFVNLVLSFCCTYVLALVSEKYIEMPGIRLGQRLIAYYNQKDQASKEGIGSVRHIETDSR